MTERLRSWCGHCGAESWDGTLAHKSDCIVERYASLLTEERRRRDAEFAAAEQRGALAERARVVGILRAQLRELLAEGPHWLPAADVVEKLANKIEGHHDGT